MSPVIERQPKNSASNLPQSDYVLRCLVYNPTAGLYVAECIDLDLIVEADSPDAAVSGLQDAMMGYLKVALENDDHRGLLPRPSPIWNRLRYNWYCLRAALSRGRRNFRLFDWSPSGKLKPSFC